VFLACKANQKHPTLPFFIESVQKNNLILPGNPYKEFNKYLHVLYIQNVSSSATARVSLQIQTNQGD
jgi:hypothetical protein